jgi:hypothetical protein
MPATLRATDTTEPPTTKQRHNTEKKGPRMDETFLVTNATQMHEEALTENRGSMKNWERFMRERLFPEARFGIVTRMLFSYPRQPKTSARLHQAFPVLEGAKFLGKDVDLLSQKPECMRFKELDTVQLHFNSFFETRRHGVVNITGIAVLPSPIMRDLCRLQIGSLAPTKDDPGGDMTLSMTNFGTEPDTMFLFMVTMLVPFSGCRCCGKRTRPSSADPTRAHMRKCGRCWAQLRYPIWYCSVECQRSDHRRHRAEEGCGIRRCDARPLYSAEAPI